ncbi:tetratricopeptide repeat protein [Sphingomonas soli]|uniref:tetratricopeptide repeat protein n=1 Tax=Sphingomonas soli TaxID=266127 RepID=UPI000B2CF83F|nr:cytochrome c biogenesis factor-like protein [Sphingomonas soli]
MMGWAMLGLVALAAVILLAITRFPKRLWTIAATGVMLGAAGYAWQGSPGLPGRSASIEKQAGEVDPGLVALREAIFGKYGTAVFTYATAAESMIRTGRPDLATVVWLGAVRKYPEDYALWSGLGLALAEQDGNQISPAAKLAFDKALALHPSHPGPQFFYGLALVRAGQFAEARPYWAKAVELTPADISYRDELRVRLFLLDRFLAAQAEQAKQKAPGPQPAPEAQPAR